LVNILIMWTPRCWGDQMAGSPSEQPYEIAG